MVHQVVRGGRLLQHLPELHEKYGPVLRISPTEVHISDPSNYDKIYNVGTRFIKDSDFYTRMEGPVATPILLTILSLDEHRFRRKMITPFFSRQSVLDVEDMVWAKANKLCDIIASKLYTNPTNIPFPAHKAVRAVAVDVITEYAYARCWNFLDHDPDYGDWYPEAIHSVQTLFPWFQAFPWTIPLFRAIPYWGKVAIFPAYKRWDVSLKAVQVAVREVRRELANRIKPPRRTIIHELIEPLASAFSEGDGLRDDGKTKKQLTDQDVFADAVNTNGAGTETTGATEERALFEVLWNPVVYRAVTKEVREAFRDAGDMRLVELEKLPWLTGIIKEALRLNPGVPGRLPRVVPPGGATFNGVYLPPGTTVSMSAWDMHHDPITFPNPTVFDPTRWIGPEDEVRARERYLVAFSRGSRGCVGQNLVMCELYCSLAAIFHRFDDLAVAPGFGPEDMEMTELVLGYHPRDNGGRRFRIVRKT